MQGNCSIEITYDEILYVAALKKFSIRFSTTWYSCHWSSNYYHVPKYSMRSVVILLKVKESMYCIFHIPYFFGSVAFIASVESRHLSHLVVIALQDTLVVAQA